MSSGYVIPTNPLELASRVQYHDPRFEEDDEEYLDPEEAEVRNVSLDTFASYFPDGDYESRIVPLLDRIPEREADFIEMYFLQKKIQADIAQIFGVTQAAVSYRLVRGVKRLKFLITIPQVTEEELRADLPKIFPARLGCPVCERSSNRDCPVCHGSRIILLDVEILVGMWGITCQSKVADKLGLTQGRVRHRFFRAVGTLASAAKVDERFLPYHQIFSIMSSKKFNILHEVRLPQWADRGVDECA
jgi:hypothetical protein